MMFYMVTVTPLSGDYCQDNYFENVLETIEVVQKLINTFIRNMHNLFLNFLVQIFIQREIQIPPHAKKAYQNPYTCIF